MYKLDFSPDGRTSLATLDKKIAQRVLDKLRWLLKNIDNIYLLRLKENLSGLYKLRVGDWRVIYEVKREQRVVTVHKVGHRSKIYR